MADAKNANRKITTSSKDGKWKSFQVTPDYAIRRQQSVKKTTSLVAAEVTTLKFSWKLSLAPPDRITADTVGGGSEA